MMGIYKITNLINGKSYIGQSVHIERRWTEHCLPSATSLIARKIKEYGKENFSFEIIEECTSEELDQKEEYYIHFYNSLVPNGYNISDSIEGKQTSFIHYNQEILNNIYKDLKEGILTIYEIGQKYNLNASTISRINNGKVHFNSHINYPIREILNPPIHNQNNVCCDCGKPITTRATRCPECYYKSKRKIGRPSREELKDMIRKYSIRSIGQKYGITDNSVRRWCDGYNLPRKKKEINSYSDEEWELI